MTSRSKKYLSREKHDGSKKGSATNAGYDEQNEVTSRQPKENPAPSKVEDKIQSKIERQSRE